MKTINVDELLADITPEAPSGQDLWLSEIQTSLAPRVRGKPGEEINWTDIQNDCIAYLKRTKDLRLGIFLSLALLQIHGLPGLSDGLELIKKMLDKFWGPLFPPYVKTTDVPRRVLILEWMSPQGTDEYRFRLRIRQAPLTRGGDRAYSMRDIEIAAGRTPAPEGYQLATTEQIDAMFAQTTPEDLKNIAQGAENAAKHLAEIIKLVGADDKAGRAPDLKELIALCDEAKKQVTSHINAATADAAPPAGAPAPGAPAAAAPRPAGVGEIRTRADVVVALEKLSLFYRANEPSSLVVQLLDQAKRWVGKNFMEILTDLTPDPKEKTLTLTIKPDKPPEPAKK